MVSSSRGGEDALKAPNTVIIHAEKDGIHDIQGYILGHNVLSYPLVVTAIEFTHVRTRLVSGRMILFFSGHLHRCCFLWFQAIRKICVSWCHDFRWMDRRMELHVTSEDRK